MSAKRCYCTERHCKSTKKKPFAIYENIKNGKRHRKKCDKGLDLHAHSRFNMRMWVIIGQLKILVLEVEDALY